jgi:hypothetical protein
VRITLRKHDEVAFAQPDGLLADGMTPRGAFGDQVVFDHALRAGHHSTGNLPGRWRLDHPGRAQVEIEIDRACQVNRSEHV